MTVPAGLALIGLTGGMASGKSTVRKMFTEAGIPALDADHLAREVVQPGQPAHDDIKAAWPEALDPDGTINRAVLGHIVFANPAARKQLEAITHPRIRQLMHQRAADLAAAGHRLAVYEASLLVEAGHLRDFVGLVVVDAPEAVRIARAMARDGLDEAAVRARIAAQFPLSEKLKVATHVIENNGDVPGTQAQVDALIAELRHRFP